MKKRSFHRKYKVEILLFDGPHFEDLNRQISISCVKQRFLQVHILSSKNLRQKLFPRRTDQTSQK